MTIVAVVPAAGHQGCGRIAIRPYTARGSLMGNKPVASGRCSVWKPRPTRRVAHRGATNLLLRGGPLRGTANHFLGADPSQWHTRVPTFGRVTYTGVHT